MDSTLIQRQYHLKHCVPLSRLRVSNQNPTPFCNLGFWVSKVSEGFCLRSIEYNTNNNNNAMAMNDSAFYASSEEDESGKSAKIDGSTRKKEGENGCKIEGFGNLIEDKGRESSSSSDFLSSGNEDRSRSSTETASSSSPSPPSVGWPVKKSASRGIEDGGKKRLMANQKQDPGPPEIEMMKERFAKLLLGEDMSGCGNGVPTALAISNAITNLCATLFGQILRLEPVREEKKAMWEREMEWLISVSDHIVELAPTWQTLPDGTKREVMGSRPRSDLYVNLPALRKLDNMLLEILDSFVNTEFWYVDKGVIATPESNSSTSALGRALKRQDEKWWLPVPRVPPCGLHESVRKQLQHKRDCTNQILKAAMAINTITLAEMDVPDSYFESLPKTARASLGDIMYGQILSDQFSCESVLDCLDLSSEHQAMDIANRVEASVHIWRRRANSKPANNNINTAKSSSKTSWEIVKDLMVDADKWDLLAERAGSIMVFLRHRFPGLPQTTLDITKIQYNKDIGKAILESYSRVLESLAFNIVARIDDVMYVDDLTKHSGDYYPVPIPSTPSRSSLSTTPTLTPPRPGMVSPLREKTPFISSSSSKSKSKSNLLPHPQRGGAKRVLTDFLTIDAKGGKENQRNSVDKVGPTSKTFEELSSFERRSWS